MGWNLQNNRIKKADYKYGYIDSTEEKKPLVILKEDKTLDINDLKEKLIQEDIDKINKNIIEQVKRDLEEERQLFNQYEQKTFTR